MIRKRISDQGSYTYTHPHLFKVTQVLLLKDKMILKI